MLVPVFVTKDTEPKAFELKSKKTIAVDVVDEMIRLKSLMN